VHRVALERIAAAIDPSPESEDAAVLAAAIAAATRPGADDDRA
jgi:hypothetical protein